MFIYAGNGRYINPAHIVSTKESGDKTEYNLVNGEVIRGTASIEHYIANLIPADGWYAVYVEPAASDNHVLVESTAPVACWALMYDGSIKGMVDQGGGVFGDATSTDSFHSFQRYSADDVPNRYTPIPKQSPA